MQRSLDGQWECMFCGRQSKVKTNIFEHIEASHMETPGYTCEICTKHCRTRNALRAHKHRSHNQNNSGYIWNPWRVQLEWSVCKIKVLKMLFRGCFPSRLWFHQDQRGHIHVQHMWVHLWQPQAENAVSPRGQTHSEPWLSIPQLWKDMSDQKRPSSSQI